MSLAINVLSCLVKCTSKNLFIYISAVLSYIKSKTTQDKRELTKEVFKLKLEVEALEQRTLNEYEIFVTQQDRHDASNSENTFTDDTSLKQKLRDKDNRCLANNTNSGCCSEKQPSSCGTNCCLENINGRNTTELEETKSKTPSVAGSKEAITIIRDKFHKDVEKIQKQLTYLIEKELFE